MKLRDLLFSLANEDRDAEVCVEAAEPTDGGGVDFIDVPVVGVEREGNGASGTVVLVTERRLGV